MPSDSNFLIRATAHHAAIRAHKLNTLHSAGVSNDGSGAKFGALFHAEKALQQPGIKSSLSDAVDKENNTLAQADKRQSADQPQTAGKDLIDFVTRPPLMIKIGLALLRPTPLGIAGAVASHFIGQALFPDPTESQALDKE